MKCPCPRVQREYWKRLLCARSCVSSSFVSQRGHDSGPWLCGGRSPSRSYSSRKSRRVPPAESWRLSCVSNHTPRQVWHTSNVTCHPL
ncbi:hypothetical protein ACN28I_29845 [Archangium gephyra]|uniref:hypothetical protein n=1 Tax=Archangium gephyra TaxID=48 RepID=UPI003B7F04A6